MVAMTAGEVEAVCKRVVRGRPLGYRTGVPFLDTFLEVWTAQRFRGWKVRLPTMGRVTDCPVFQSDDRIP
jgi:hypothetical protein